MASREAPSQASLLRDLEEAHRWVNDRIIAVQPVQSTVGDEFQGLYEEVRAALSAALLLRLRLKGRYDLRIGIGWGEVTRNVVQGAPLVQSGSGWWAAREAIEEVSRLAEARGWPRTLRTRVHGLSSPWEPTLNGFLICQDHLLAGMDEKDARITLGLFEGRRQHDLADELGISQSEVSRRQLENGPSTVYRAYEGLEALAP